MFAAAEALLLECLSSIALEHRYRLVLSFELLLADFVVFVDVTATSIVRQIHHPPSQLRRILFRSYLVLSAFFVAVLRLVLVADSVPFLTCYGTVWLKKRKWPRVLETQAEYKKNSRLNFTELKLSRSTTRHSTSAISLLTSTTSCIIFAREEWTNLFRMQPGR